MVVSFITIFILSVNPFLEPLTNFEGILLKQSSEISAKDKRNFPVYDQTHKIDSVDFQYMGYPVIFLAFKKGERDTFQSLLLYVEGDSLFEKKIEYRFGPPNSTMTVDALISHQSETQAFDHSSDIWVREDFAMLVSKVHHTNGSQRFRVWIKEIK